MFLTDPGLPSMLELLILSSLHAGVLLSASLLMAAQQSVAWLLVAPGGFQSPSTGHVTSAPIESSENRLASNETLSRTCGTIFKLL